MKLSPEPLNRFECYFLNTAADGNRLASEVGHPALGYLVFLRRERCAKARPAADAALDKAALSPVW